MSRIKLERNLKIVKLRDVDKMTFRAIAAIQTATDKPISESVVSRIYHKTKAKMEKRKI